MEHKLERRLGAIGKITSKEIHNLYEVVVGSPSGMEDAQIRVFFKDFGNTTWLGANLKTLNPKLIHF